MSTSPGPAESAIAPHATRSTGTTAGHVLDVVGDPMRRRILEALRGGELPVGALADRLPIRRPAVSKHLAVLGDAGLVRHRVAGTRHLYALDPTGVEAARSWFDGLWDEALAAFTHHVETAAPQGPAEEED